MNAAGMYSK
ncbi:Protein of unknown function [Bacillus cereus]|uniref:Uncharacterized protein n=1 Tax=Bacillus wiedmannii TaxID=1890302 RepID=A0AB37YIQ2_9BACI|nr:Protein of unknown function [Bacillus wiedmannii]SCN29682.1 Protein of unknown function [Bacillus cereus]